VTRTTITIDENLLADAKVEAARTGKTFGELVTEALRERLARRTGAADAGRRLVILPTSAGGLAPGVDLDNNAALRDLLDEDGNHVR
jgi:hypothetical protein